MSATIAPPEHEKPPILAPLDALAWTRAPEPPKRVFRMAAGEPLLSLPVARLVAFAALALWGSEHWMRMLEPSEPKRGWATFAVSLIAAGLMLLAGRFQGRRRALAIVVALIPLLALVFLAGRVANELLLPTNWGELEGGISRGISDLPGVRVPYRGLDQWVRTVIPLGGSFLVVLAAVLAFFPRRKPGKLGFRWAALLVLVTLFVVPVVSIGFFHEFLRGSALALMMIAFIALEKVRRPDALGALGLALLGVLGALFVAPVINLDQPWWDYETWALETSSSKSTAYDWDANYDGLNWPRDGRELLRIQAKQPAYWKAENLDVFDGSRWVRSQNSYSAPEYPVDQPKLVKTWTQKLRVSVRNLRTDEFITAGYAFDVQIPRLLTVQSLDGIFLSPRTLRRGDTYTTTVYTPHPTQNQRRRAGTDYDQQLEPYTTLYLAASRLTGAPRHGVQFPFFGDETTPINVQPADDESAESVIARGGLQRTYELSRQLLEGARTPEDYVARVLSYLAQPQFTYSEQPPASAHTLDGFLFDAKSGYCQQYAGAMALLLRMAGIPARVSTGFSTGATDTKTGEYVVRDFDAHAWVEVYYPGIGWLTFDPTPAASPARSQPQDAATHTNLGSGGSAPTIGDPLSERGATTAATTPDAPWWRWPALAVVLLAAFAAGFLGVRRHRRGAPPAMSELERALKRTHRELAPGTTLHALELRFAETPAAAGYVRALRESRYRDHPSRPTRAQRRGLRSELGRGRGILGRLRAWWALPPR